MISVSSPTVCWPKKREKFALHPLVLHVILCKYLKGVIVGSSYCMVTQSDGPENVKYQKAIL